MEEEIAHRGFGYIQGNRCFREFEVSFPSNSLIVFEQLDSLGDFSLLGKGKHFFWEGGGGEQGDG